MAMHEGDWVKARWDFVPEPGLVMTTGELPLPLQKGERMRITGLCPNNWLRVETEAGRKGVVPAAYCKPDRDTPVEVVEALWSYKASGVLMSSGDMDISFSKKDRMLVLQHHQGWIRVQLRGKIGVVGGQITPLTDTDTCELCATSCIGASRDGSLQTNTTTTSYFSSLSTKESNTTSP